MFFIGQLSGSPSGAPLQTDIIGLATGTITNTSQLTHPFVPDTFKLVNTVPTNWELVDAAAGAVANGVTPKVLRSPWTDDPTKFKHVLIDGRFAGQLTVVGYESWNAVTHVGTNPAGGGVFTALDWHNLHFPANGWLMVSAGPAHLLIMVFSNGASGPSNQPSFQLISEYTREDPWNGVANGYPAWVHHGGYQSSTASLDKSNIGFTRLLNTNSTPPADVTGTKAETSTARPSGALFKIVPESFYFNGDGVGTGLETIGRHSGAGANNSAGPDKQASFLVSPLKLMPWYAAASLGAQMGGSLTKKNQALYAFRNAGWAPGDEFDYNGERYMVFNMAGASDVIAVKEA